MVEPKYIKKKKRKKKVAIAGGVASLALAVFIIVAFLGKVVGTFTVSIKATNVKMALSTSSNFEEKTTYLWVNKLPQMDVHTHAMMLNHDEIDSETTDWHIGAKKNSKGKETFLNYFKYTFFVKNTGEKAANYTFNLNIVENNRPKNVAYALDDILRVRFYDNVEEDQHSYTTYARKTRSNPHYDEGGNESLEEAVSTQPDTDGTFYGYAKEFVSDTTILTRQVEDFKPGDIRRYTVLCWLEGFDPQAYETAPENCSLKLGVNISADEKKEEAQ